MLINPHTSPICPRCGGSVMSPVAWPAVTLGAAVFLICCPNCGATMGSIRREDGDWDDAVEAAPAGAVSDGAPHAEPSQGISP